MGYSEDLAAIHVDGFTAVEQAATAVVVAHLDRLGSPGVLFEAGCGGGGLLAAARDAGHVVHGVDISAGMVAAARHRCPEADVVQGSLWTHPIPPADAVVAVGEVVNYGFDEAVGEQALEAWIEQAFHALRPGGLLLFDAAGPGRAPPYPEAARFRKAGADWSVESWAWEDADHAWLTRRIASTRGGRHRTETHRLRLFEPRRVLQMLQDAGFAAQTRNGYGDQSLPAGWTVFLARKPPRPAAARRKPV